VRSARFCFDERRTAFGGNRIVSYYVAPPPTTKSAREPDKRVSFFYSSTPEYVFVVPLRPRGQTDGDETLRTRARIQFTTTRSSDFPANIDGRLSVNPVHGQITDGRKSTNSSTNRPLWCARR